LDAPRLALDMGHVSPQMIFSNCREIVPPEEAERNWRRNLRTQFRFI